MTQTIEAPATNSTPASSSSPATTVNEMPRTVLAVYKVRLSEWLAGGECDEAPLALKYPDRLERETHRAVSDVLNHYSIKTNTANESDWVEITYSIDDRESTIHPGSWVIVWSDSKLSVLEGIQSVTIVDGKPVVVF